jgi:hypothetical protein
MTEIQLHRFGDLSDSDNLGDLCLQDESTLAVISPDVLTSEFSQKEIELTDLEGALDSLTYNLALRNAGAVVIDNKAKPNLGEVAPQLGYDQLPSGLWYAKPSLGIVINIDRYMPKLNMGSLEGVYTINVILKPNWNSEKRKVGDQAIHVNKVEKTPDWFRNTIHEQCVRDEDLVADIRYADFSRFNFTHNFLINTSLEKTKEYFRNIAAAIEGDGHVAGISVSVSLGYSQTNWGYFSGPAVHGLGFKNIDGLEFFGTWFKKFNPTN